MAEFLKMYYVGRDIHNDMDGENPGYAIERPSYLPYWPVWINLSSIKFVRAEFAMSQILEFVDGTKIKISASFTDVANAIKDAEKPITMESKGMGWKEEIIKEKNPFANRDKPSKE